MMKYMYEVYGGGTMMKYMYEVYGDSTGSTWFKGKGVEVMEHVQILK